MKFFRNLILYKSLLGYAILSFCVALTLFLSAQQLGYIKHQAIIERQVRGELAQLIESNQRGTKFEYLRQAEADFVLCRAINRSFHIGLKLDCGQIKREAILRVSIINLR